MMRLIIICMYLLTSLGATASAPTFMDSYTFGINAGYQENCIGLSMRNVHYGSRALGVHVDKNYLFRPKFFYGFGLDGNYNLRKKKQSIRKLGITLLKGPSFAVTLRGGTILKQSAFEVNGAILFTHLKQKIVENQNPSNRSVIHETYIGYALGSAITAPLSERGTISLNYRYEFCPYHALPWKFHKSHNTFIKLSYCING